MRQALRVWGLALLALLAAWPGRAQEAAPDYQLDLDTGGHRAVIRALVASPDGATLYSASDDKTVRAWDWRAGASTATYRGQIGPGAEGLVNALALSADGHFIATAGYFGKHLSPEPPFGDVRIFDTRSGRLVRVLHGPDLVVDALAYDAARDELAAAGQGGMVWRWAHPFAEAEPQVLPPLDSESNRVSHLAYVAGGSRLLATTFDYGLKLWDAASGLPVEVPEGEPLWDIRLTALAVSADGSRFAIAGEDGTLQVRDAASGALLAALPQQDYRPDALAFTRGGAALAVSCGYRCGSTHRTVLFDLASGAALGAETGHDGGIHAAVALPGGDLVATAGGMANEIRIWDAVSGEVRASLKGSGRPVTAVALRADGAALAWGSADPCPDLPLCPDRPGPLQSRLDLPTPDLSFVDPRPADAEAQGFGRAVTAAGGIALTAAEVPGSGFAGSALRAAAGGREVTLTKDGVGGYYFSAFGLLPDGARMVTGGGDGVLLVQALADGSVLGELPGHTGDILALAVDSGGHRLLTGSADQTMKLWNLDTGRLIVSIFADGRDWIIWTPQGYYHSSPDGDRLVGWHLNQGEEHEARFIRARQLRTHLNSPEIVRRAIITGDAAGAAKELRGTDTELLTLLARKPPEFQMRIAEEVKVPEGYAAIELTGASVEDLEDWGFSVLVNDRRVPPMRIADPAGRFLYQVPVEDGENSILVTGANDFGYVTERSGQRLFSLPPEKMKPKGTLYVAVVGINDYPKLKGECDGRDCDLAFPVADAVEFLATIGRHTAPLFDGMVPLVMVSPASLAAEPEKAAELAKWVDPGDVLDPDAQTVTGELVDFLTRPGPDDTTIVFVASHGLNLGERFFLIPENGQKRDGEWRVSSLVNWQVIQDQIGLATGRRILMLDTCHAANAFNAKLEKEAADARVIVFSATAANNTAQERKDLGHGVFTYSLIEGLSGRADSGDGVRLLSLADYVYREVVRLTDGKQEPFYHISQTANFLLAEP
jgi:uncharacterized caspase-like protein/WD40 repeat protein